MKKRIPFVDLERQHAPIREELRKAALRVLEGGRYIGGPEVAGFEKEMAQWLGVDEVCGVSCATMGLFSILKSMGIGPGDEVITTAHTAIATAEAVSLTGARVIFADLAEESCNLDPADVERRITDRTRAVIAVHLYGIPVDMDALLGVTAEHGLRLVEDCAQAQGARYRGRRLGTFGDAAIFSFFPSKNLGGFGDGGAVTARDPALLKKIRMFSNHGREQKFIHEFEGINSRLDAIQAALLRVCLPHLDTWNGRRREVAGRYDRALGEIGEITIPLVPADAEPVYHVYGILVPDRDDMASYLKERGVATGLHYPYSLNVQPAYAAAGYHRGTHPRAEYFCDHELSLPMYPDMTEDESEYVCACIREYFGK